MSQGICVVDAELRLVAWNRRYAELFGFPAELLVVGRAVADLTRYNLERGLLGDGDDARAIERRLDHMRAGTPHLSERRLPDGTMVEIRGNPMPGGGFVATFTDVTAFRPRRGRSCAAPTKRWSCGSHARTRELAAAARARRSSANRAKSRFLAAVSHDPPSR